MYATPTWAGLRFRSAVRLALGISLGLLGMVPHLLDLSWDQTIPYIVAGSLVVIALVSVVVLTLLREGFTRHAWAEVAPSIFIVVLVAVMCVPLWVTSGALGPWSGDVLVIGFVIYYLAELRGVVKSHPTLYAGLAISGIVVIISLAMADVEAEAQNRRITNAGDAMLWALAQVFRSGVLVDVKPITPAGAVLGFVVILTSVFFAAVLFSAITAWAVRQGASRDRQASAGEAVRESVLAALREAGVIEADPEPEVGTPRLWIDIDWIAGTRRGKWWFARHATAAEVLALLETAPDIREVPGVIAVVHGTADREWDIESTDSIQVEVASDVAAWMLEHARPGDVVVTGRRGLVDDLADAGIEVQAPGALMERLAGQDRATP